MEGLLIDTFRLILTYLDAKELCQSATVSKKWCYELNSPQIWRDLFLHNYKTQSMPSSDDREKKFYNLARTTPLPQIYNDWKRAYIIKMKCQAPQTRVWCLFECAMISGHATPQLDKHHLGPLAHQPLMFENFATKVVEYNDPPSTSHTRAARTDVPCPGLFQQVVKTLGEDLSRAWMVVDATRDENLAHLLSQESNAVFTTLVGSFFNLANVNNFPYLVKVDSCMKFCEHVYDMGGGNWGYMFVRHENLVGQFESMWYLNFEPNLYPSEEMKTMACLRRHLMKFYTWYDNYFRLGELQNIIMMLHIYEKSVREELFYEITTSTFPQKTPIVDYYILIDDKLKYFPEKITVITRTMDFVPTKINLNGKKEDANLLSQWVTLGFLWRAEVLIKKHLPNLADTDLIPQLQILSEQAKSYGFVSERDYTSYFTWYYTDEKFAEDPTIKDVLNNTNVHRDNPARIKLINELVEDRMAKKYPEEK